MKNLRIDQRPRLLRSGISRGLDTPQADSAVDPAGGDQRAGIIRGMAIITRGEALGHGGWVDREFIDQVHDAINGSEKGVKARFTHPGLSGDGLGKHTGRVKNARPERDVLRGDLHFSAAAHQTPDGDLAGYLMNLAEEDPAAFGNSIAFDFDRQAETEFLVAHGAEWAEDELGRYLDLEGFKSPDKDNVHNLPHFRLAKLHAVDAVDDPAANPEGLFHRGQEVADDAEKIIAFALGLSGERPALRYLDADPDRISGFVQRFLGRHKLAITTESGEIMPSLKPKSFAQRGAELKSQAIAKGQLAEKCMDDKEDEEMSGVEKESTKKEDDRAEDEEKDADKQAGYDKSTRTEQSAKPADAELAAGGEPTKGPSPGDQAASQEEYQIEEKKKAKKSKDDDEEETPVGSPSSEKGKGIGPMGDPSNNVGMMSSEEFRAEGKKYLAAFGESGAVWFAQGKTFAEAQELHTARLKSENERLAKENADLQKKVYGKRGETTPLSANSTPLSADEQKLARLTSRLGPGMARFAAGLQIPKPSSN